MVDSDSPRVWDEAARQRHRERLAAEIAAAAARHAQAAERPGLDGPVEKSVVDTAAAREARWAAERREKEAAFERAVLRFNRRHAVVAINGHTRILKEITTPDGGRDHVYMRVDDFRLEHANARQERPGYAKETALADEWLVHPKRRQYRGVTFAPGRPVRGWFNTWSGWAVKAKPGSCELFKAHLLDNVCGGDDRLFAWLWGWMAQAIQSPAEPAGIAVVLRGRPGTGKTKVGEILGQLFGVHGLLVDSADHVTGKHNGHLERCLLLHADEAVFTQDRAAEGRLKSLITSRTLTVEPKGIDAYTVPNYVRLLLTTEAEWAIPASVDDRRFAVFDVGDGRRLDHDYFAAVDREAASGGLAALLHELQRVDLSGIDLREAPRTAALRDQKLISMTPGQRWWMERLYAGAQLRGGDWLDFVSADLLYDDFCRAAERRGIRTRSDEVEFGHMLRALYPAIRRRQRRIAVGSTGGATRRIWGYTFGPLDEARSAFERVVGHTVEWPEEDEA